MICPYDAAGFEVVTKENYLNVFSNFCYVTSVIGTVSKTSYTEEELIALIKKGEASYFRPLVEKHKSYVYTLAMRVVSSHEDAQEVAQDSFIKAYNNIHSFKGDAKFSTWLYRIVFNTAISKKRKKRLPETDIDQAAGILDADGMSSSEQLSQQERKMWVNRAVEQLPEDDAFLISLYYFKELTLEEIEKITGFAPNNVKVKIFRARKKLAEWLGRSLNEEISSLT